MHKRLKAIHKYYNNLEYNRISKEEALRNISILTKKVQLKNIDWLNRFSFTATLTKENLSIFQSASEHVDIVTDIIQVLNELDFQITTLERNNLTDEVLFQCHLFPAMIFIYTTWKESEVQLFFEDSILEDTKFDSKLIRNEIYNIKTFISRSSNEMMLLQDSDLYAVISYLMITRKFTLNKIWVQQQIQEKFLSLLKKNFHHLDFPICMFRFEKDLLTPIKNDNVIKITSIWSENIVTAKNLAFSLHREIIYINAHMNTHCLNKSPLLGVFEKAMRDAFLYNIHHLKTQFKMKPNEIFNDNAQNYPLYNAFYYGAWKAANVTYVIRKGGSWAYITIDNIKECIDSANKGLEIWSAMSYDSRLQVLSNFVFTLECNGKFLLANVISRLIKGSYLVKNHLMCYEKGRFEITDQHYPKGVIFLKEENEITLFSRLTQILITGNSVIVLCDANSCNLAPYCNMFATAQIPSGVINMLPIESLEDLEKFLFVDSYADYTANFFFRKSQMNNLTLEDLSMFKQIIVAIK
ncbi:uncharacterized protein [Linepithema humile]|uniref:uncharacterized protein isoform X2 n=1 Tax=Linepithema humile TaxID=83485 RepID=UPI0006235304|nr:PREDICTED: uncharacterized protein LOC105672345 [Linepithema humile]